MQSESIMPTMRLTQQEQDGLLELLNHFSYILEKRKHEFDFEMYTIQTEHLVEIKSSYMGFNYHDEDWTCWEYVRAEKITDTEFYQAENNHCMKSFEKPFDCLVGIAGRCYVCETTGINEFKKEAYIDQISALPGFYRITIGNFNNR